MRRADGDCPVQAALAAREVVGDAGERTVRGHPRAGHAIHPAEAQESREPVGLGSGDPRHGDLLVLGPNGGMRPGEIRRWGPAAAAEGGPAKVESVSDGERLLGVSVLDNF
jgi:hypothetical protein